MCTNLSSLFVNHPHATTGGKPWVEAEEGKVLTSTLFSFPKERPQMCEPLGHSVTDSFQPFLLWRQPMKKKKGMAGRSCGGLGRGGQAQRPDRGAGPGSQLPWDLFQAIRGQHTPRFSWTETSAASHTGWEPGESFSPRWGEGEASQARAAPGCL